MTEFYYVALNDHGKEIRSRVSAISKSAAISAIEAEGLIPIEILLTAPKKVSFLSKDIPFFTKKLTDIDHANLAEILANLFAANLPAQDVLAIAKTSGVSKQAELILDKAQRKLEGGKTFAETFSENNDMLSSEFTTFVRIGDLSNNMAGVMHDAALFFKTRYETKAKIKSALIYPCILLAASILLIAMLVLFLVPTLSPIFEAADVPPPLFFSIAMGLQATFSVWWPVIITGTVILWVVLLAFTKLGIGQDAIGALKYKLPLFGEITLLSRLAADSRFLALLMGSGANLTTALDQTLFSRKQDAIGAIYTHVSNELREGASFLSAIRDNKLLPKEYITFIGLAENTNNWGVVLNNLAKVLEAKVERKRGRLLQVMTPAITLLVGLAIGLLVYSVIDAILQINDLAFTQ